MTVMQVASGRRCERVGVLTAGRVEHAAAEHVAGPAGQVAVHVGVERERRDVLANLERAGRAAAVAARDVAVLACLAAVDLAVNVLTLALQFFVTGRLLSRLGATVMLVALPVLSVGANLFSGGTAGT